MPPLLVLLLALIGISASGPLVRSSHADPLAIAVWRLGLSLIVVAVALAITGSWRELRRLSMRDVAIAAGAGVMLALHFWSWNASVHMTSVSSSVVLVNMHPPVVALLSAVWLGEKPGRRQWIGITVAMLGAIVVARGDANSTATIDHRHALLGDMLALVGAVTVAVYFVSGRRLRVTLSLWPYVALVYGAAFVTLTSISLARGVPLVGYPPRELAIFAGLAAGPMLLGHTGMNYALRFFPAYVVNLTVLGEPIGATLLAMLIPWIREMPSNSTLIGGAITLCGVLLAAWRRSGGTADGQQ
jgi:drug/metabolite transporter (DMT)-like permease